MNRAHAVCRHRQQWQARRPAGQAIGIDGDFEPRDAPLRAHQTSRSAPAAPAAAWPRHDRHGRTPPARRRRSPAPRRPGPPSRRVPHAQRRIQHRRRAGQHRESRPALRDQVADHADVAAAVLDADDVGVARQRGGRFGQQVHAGERGDVVEDDRRRRGIGDGGVVLQQRLGRDARLEERPACAPSPRPHPAPPRACRRPPSSAPTRARCRQSATCRLDTPRAPPQSAHPTRRRRARGPRRCCPGRPGRQAASWRSGARCGGRPTDRCRRPQRAWSRARRYRAGASVALGNYIKGLGSRDEGPSAIYRCCNSRTVASTTSGPATRSASL